jgi:hypothetical protein
MRFLLLNSILLLAIHTSNRIIIQICNTAYPPLNQIHTSKLLISNIFRSLGASGRCRGCDEDELTKDEGVDKTVSGTRLLLNTVSVDE